MRPSHYTNRQAGITGCNICERPVRGAENALHYLVCAQLTCLYRPFRLHVKCAIAENEQKLDVYKLTQCGDPIKYRLKCCCGGDLEPSEIMLRDSLWSGKSEGDRVVEDSDRDKDFGYARAIDEAVFAQEERDRLAASARAGIGTALACALSALIHLCALFGPIGPGTTAVLCAVAFGLFCYWLCRHVFCVRTKIPSAYKFASADAIQKIARTTRIAEAVGVCARYSAIAAGIFAIDILVELAMLAVIRNFGGGGEILESSSPTNFSSSSSLASAGGYLADEPLYLPTPRMFAAVFVAFLISVCAWPLRRLHRTYIDARAEIDLRIVSWALLAWAKCHAIDVMYSAVQSKITHGRKSAAAKRDKKGGGDDGDAIDEQYAALEASLEPTLIVVVPAECKTSAKRLPPPLPQVPPKITKANRELRKAAQDILRGFLLPLLLTQ